MYFNEEVWNFIKKNKPIIDRSLSVRVDLFLGYLRNGQQWYSKNDYEKIKTMPIVPWSDVVVIVKFNDEIVYQGTPTQQHNVEFQIQDTEDLKSCALEICLQGLVDQHMPAWYSTGEHGGVVLLVDGTIEHIPLSILMPDYGIYNVENGTTNVATGIMGQNGRQTLTFTTPFYSWLHDRREKLIWQLVKKNRQ
jgi:hypothetical protein